MHQHPPPKHLVYALHDCVMLLAPAGWTALDLRLSEHGGALRLAEIAAEGAGGTAPRPKPSLNVEPKAEAERLSEGLVELGHVLSHQGKAWDGAAVRVERGAGFVDWKLLRADGGVAWFIRLGQEELDQLLVTDALFDAVGGTERAFAALQERFEQRLGRVARFHYDAPAAVLTIEREGKATELPAQVVGRYFSDGFVWVWGWADRDAPATASERVRRVCAPDAQPPGLSALWRDHFHCDEGFAWALAGHVVVSVGARGLYRAEVPGTPEGVFFAVMAEPG